MNPQNIAADPKASVFLTANAGSGKTSTLVNRVARLLLNGARPEHILCVTYTKAAAAEMQGRLFEELGKWAVYKDADLLEVLRRIDEGHHELGTARALFARALETPGGLKIQTIHGFCEKLLRRFPLEAGLSPAFSVLDDLQARELNTRAVDQLLTTDGEVAGARDRLIRLLKVSGFEKLTGQFIHQHDAIAGAFDGFRDEAEARGLNPAEALYQGLGLDGIITPDDLERQFFAGFDWDAIKDLAGSLAAGKDKTSQTNAEAWRTLYAARDHGPDAEICLGLFYTAKRSLRASFYTNGTAPADKLLIDRMAEKVQAFFEQRNAAVVAERTWLTLWLFAAFSQIYQKLKADMGRLDFQDLIKRSKALLATADMAEWVLYKLDGGIEHILVDEAQDTSDDQWAIVKALSGGFFDDKARLRTVFAVGDEKQSIYGFQGARPDRFLETRQYYILKGHVAGQTVMVPELITSYRALPHLMSFVDKVFEDREATFALNFRYDEIRHSAHREDQGLVELWSQIRPIEIVTDPEAEDQLADDEDALDVIARTPQQRLAQQIAGHIADEIRLGRAVHDRSIKNWRPMHAGDVLILVRKRDSLFEHIIRELKKSGVAVSGADRLKLSSHIAFEDLRALMRFCFQERDDLSLACVLRSPMCDLSEGALFDLCQARDHGRTSTLWGALLEAHDDGGPLDQARAFLGWALKASKERPAFEFLTHALNRRDGRSLSQRQRFITRLGAECEDVLDETLSLAQMAEGAGRVSVAAFLDLCEFNASEIKREQEEGGHKVRVMTVHGSKGLEAPWVILPMGPVYGSARNEDLLVISEADSGNGAPPELYLKTGGNDLLPERLKTILGDKAKKNDQEALRLYYVALTRARDRLTLCGYLGKRAGKRGHFDPWYDMAATAFAGLEDVKADTLRAHVDFAIEGHDDKDAVPVLLFGERSANLPRVAEAERIRPPLPPFSRTDEGPQGAVRQTWRAISQMGDEDRHESERAPSPLSMLKAQAPQLGRYRRGNLIHKLFEILPDMDPARRDAVAEAYLAKQPDLDADIRTEIASSVRAVLEDARFAEAFGMGSRAEVAIAGQVGPNLSLSGRIDRLVVTDERVLVIDYKSNRPAPDRAEDAAIDYQRQMAGYVALLRQIYPGRRIEAALLWTDGPKLTPLSETLVNLRLSEIATD